MKDKNILEFCLSPDLGGLELFMVNCFKYFKKKTTTKIAIAPGKKIDKYINYKDKFYLKRNKLLLIISAFQLAKYIDKNNINIIHFHWNNDIFIVVLAKILSTNKPKIIQTRNMHMTRYKNDFYHKWLYKNIHTIHAVTNQVKQQIEKFIPDNVRPNVAMIYMGVESSLIKLEEIKILKNKYNLKDEFIIGIVGRIEHAKGQYLIIEAIKRIEKLNIKALIVGDTMDSKYLNQLKQQTIALKIQDKIIFTGFTKQVNTYMQLFDVNVLATTNETFGLVVIEAMINKICIIAANKGGPLEIIEDGVDGLLFNNTKNDLAQKIEFLYKNTRCKNDLAIKGYKKAQDKFDLKRQNDKLFVVIQNL